MKNETILIRIEPATKIKLKKLANVERRSMTSLVLSLIDKKIVEVENGIRNANNS